MKPLKIPDSYNYIGVFLTFACNLHCPYCINYFEGKLSERKTIKGDDWIKLLNRVESREDLPLSLQGGEPSIHPDFLHIINSIKPNLNIDILTNLQFDIDKFMKKVDPRRVKRDAPYASIRISYHPEVMDLKQTIEKTLKMQKKGFSVGIWSVLHPKYKTHILEAQEKCLGLGIDFRTKEFLGEYHGKLWGTYKYPEACAKKSKKKVLCKTSELLIDPQAEIFRCHHDIYSGSNPLGSLFDEDFRIEEKFRTCRDFGFCNPCDIKVKTNRFQEYGHTSVEIKLSD
ncbi:MAG: radical SAM protein [Candidatus Omnitrophica bacterium]|nr:radical SAM protein [Candidatus Omnitrophota bacterium]